MFYFWPRWAAVAALAFLCHCEQGLLSGCDALRLLTAVASLVEEHRLSGCEGFSSCDSLAQLP